MASLLGLDEIRRLSAALRELFAFQASVRDRDPLARHLRDPQIPSVLSRSLAAYLLQSGDLPHRASSIRETVDGEGLQGSLSGRGTLSIEVKATGETGRQRLVRRDLEAGLLVWLDFDSYFADPHQRGISVVLMFEPRRHLANAGELPYESFLKACLKAGVGDIAVQEVDLEALFERGRRVAARSFTDPRPPATET